MTEKTKVYSFMISVLMIILFIALGGCTLQDSHDAAEDTVPSPQETALPSPTPQETPAESPDAPEATATVTDVQPAASMHAEGEYVGRIDSRSIEVIVDGTAAAYRLTDTTAMQVPALTEGIIIGFTYEPNDAGQNTIVRFDATPQTLTAVYVGQADAHTIEVTTADGEAITLQLTGDALTQVESLETGDTIEITFTMNDTGQNVADTLIAQ